MPAASLATVVTSPSHSVTPASGIGYVAAKRDASRAAWVTLIQRSKANPKLIVPNASMMKTGKRIANSTAVAPARHRGSRAGAVEMPPSSWISGLASPTALTALRHCPLSTVFPRTSR